MLRRTYRPKSDEIIWEWRKIHNEELNELYSLSNIVRVTKSRRMRWTGNVASLQKSRGVYRVLVGKPEGKRSLGRRRGLWKDNIKMAQDVGYEDMDWIDVAQDKDRWRVLKNAIMNFRVP